jgi:hypothetical protein
VTKARIWILGTVLVIAAVLGLGWTVGLSPLLSQATTADTERASVEAVNAAQTAALAAMREQFEDIDSLREELEIIRLSVPAQVDADLVYAMLSGYQTGTGAVVASITVGEAIQYGIPVNADESADGTAAPAAAAPGSLSTDLYTVPVTITFDGVPAGQVLAFVKAMQIGQRLFLVTSVTGNGETGESGSATITAYMFVIHDPSIADLGVSGGSTPEPEPEPTATPAPEATENPE